MTTHVVVNASTGRMGRELLEALLQNPDFELAGALARENHEAQGQDAARLVGLRDTGIEVSSDLEPLLRPDRVLVDFSLPAYSLHCLEKAVAAGCPVVIGTTGFSAADRERIRDAARKIPVILAPNMSVGVATLLSLVEKAAASLGKDTDIEIVEAHHRYKQDAPSGTALQIGEVVAQARGKSLEDIAVYERHGRTGPRQTGSLGFSVVRAGDIVGNHDVIFGLKGESVTVRHEAVSRQCFAEGALRAAAWLQGRPPGLYSMQDVLAGDGI